MVDSSVLCASCLPLKSVCPNPVLQGDDVVGGRALGGDYIMEMEAQEQTSVHPCEVTHQRQPSVYGPESSPPQTAHPQKQEGTKAGVPRGAVLSKRPHLVLLMLGNAWEGLSHASATVLLPYLHPKDAIAWSRILTSRLLILAWVPFKGNFTEE